jgi:hypothetical protein
MANPYDFTSGYLSARALKEQERKNQTDEAFRRDVMGPYYKSATDENNRKAGYYGVLQRDKVLEQNVRRAKGIDMFGWDPLGDYTDENPFGFTYTPTPPAAVTPPADPANPAGGIKVTPPKLANGTPGGINLSGQSKDAILTDPMQSNDVLVADASGTTRRTGGINTSPQVVSDMNSPQGGDAAAPAGARPRDPALILKDENPAAANAIAMNFYTAPMKDIPKMLDKVSKWDLFEGKISSKDVLANVQAMRTMQAEGVAEAMSFMLQGNKQAALKAFANVGSDLGEGVADLKPIKIKNPVAGVIKGVSDEYEGVQIIYKDGHTMNWDPRKFLISTASLKEYTTSKDAVENNLRSQAASKYGDDIRAESNRINSALREDQLRIRLEDQAIGRITGEAKSELTRQTNAFLDPKSPVFIADDKAREVKNSEIESGIRPMMDIAIQNVTLFGNRGATVNGVMQAVKSQQPALGSNGKPIVEVKGGQKFVKMASGVWLPVTDQAK